MGLVLLSKEELVRRYYVEHSGKLNIGTKKQVIEWVYDTLQEEGNLID